MTRTERIVKAAEEYVEVMTKEGEIFRVSEAEERFLKLIEAVKVDKWNTQSS